jgi:hypothetical protein
MVPLFLLILTHCIPYGIRGEVTEFLALRGLVRTIFRKISLYIEKKI